MVVFKCIDLVKPYFSFLVCNSHVYDTGGNMGSAAQYEVKRFLPLQINIQTTELSIDTAECYITVQLRVFDSSDPLAWGWVMCFSDWSFLFSSST